MKQGHHLPADQRQSPRDDTAYRLKGIFCQSARDSDGPLVVTTTTAEARQCGGSGDCQTVAVDQ